MPGTHDDHQAHRDEMPGRRLLEELLHANASIERGELPPSIQEEQRRQMATEIAALRHDIEAGRPAPFTTLTFCCLEPGAGFACAGYDPARRKRTVELAVHFPGATPADEVSVLLQLAAEIRRQAEFRGRWHLALLERLAATGVLLPERAEALARPVREALRGTRRRYGSETVSLGNATEALAALCLLDTGIVPPEA